jgi:hypothetical protein
MSLFVFRRQPALQAGNKTLVLVCGRPSFAMAVSAILSRIGHTNVHVFG